MKSGDALVQTLRMWAINSNNTHVLETIQLYEMYRDSVLKELSAVAGNNENIERALRSLGRMRQKVCMLWYAFNDLMSKGRVDTSKYNDSYYWTARYGNVPSLMELVPTARGDSTVQNPAKPKVVMPTRPQIKTLDQLQDMYNDIVSQNAVNATLQNMAKPKKEGASPQKTKQSKLVSVKRINPTKFEFPKIKI